MLDFIIQLSHNIPFCQLMVGEMDELITRYKDTSLNENGLISKEHPAFSYYPGIKDERDWIYPAAVGYLTSFFKFWKKCQIY